MDEASAQTLLVETALIGLDQSDARTVRTFVDEFLRSPLNSEGIAEFWQATPAEIYFHDSNALVRFLRALYDRLGESPYSDGISPN